MTSQNNISFVDNKSELRRLVHSYNEHVNIGSDVNYSTGSTISTEIFKPSYTS